MKTNFQEQTFVVIQGIRIIFEYSEFRNMKSVTAAPQTDEELEDLQAMEEHKSHTPLPEAFIVLNITNQNNSLSTNINIQCLSKYSEDIADGMLFAKKVLAKAREILLEKTRIDFDLPELDNNLFGKQKSDDDIEELIRISKTRDQRTMNGTDLYM